MSSLAFFIIIIKILNWKLNKPEYGVYFLKPAFASYHLFSQISDEM